LPGGEDEDGDCDERENPDETRAQRASGQGAHFGARIFLVVAKIGDAVDGHGGGACGDHGDDDPQNLAEGGPAMRREARGEQRSR